MRSLRALLVVAFVSTSLAACARPGPAPGAIRVHGVPGQGSLVLDGVDRGPVMQVQLFEGLAPGVHVLELRRAGVPVLLETCVVRSAMVLDVRVDVPVVPSVTSAPMAPLARATSGPAAASVGGRDGAGAETEAETEAEAETAAETAAEAGAETETAAETETETETEAGAETETDAETETATETETETESVTATATEAEPEAETETESESEAAAVPPEGRRVERTSTPTAPRSRSADRRSASPRAARETPPRARDAELEGLLQGALERDAEALPTRDAERAAVREAERAAALPPLPDAPSGEDVRRVIAEIAPALRACMREGDAVTIELQVAGGTGRPTAVRIAGPLSGTPAGACVARTAREARFPRFRRVTFPIRVPFRR